MSAARVAKLEALLDRVRRRAGEKRTLVAVPPLAAKRSVPPPRISEPPEDISDAAEYVDDVEEVIEEPATALVASPEPTEDEMVVEVSSEEVEVDGDESEPRVAARGSGPVPGIATSETHMRTTPPSADAGGVLEVTDDSVPEVAAADSDSDYDASRHTPPPASGSQRAGEPEEAHDPSGQWNQVPTGEDTGVRSSPRISTRPSERPSARPSEPPASARQASVAPLAPASGKHPSMPAPAAQAPVAAPAPEAPTATFVQLEGSVVTSRGALPTYEATAFTSLLDDSLDL